MQERIVELNINKQKTQLSVDPETPLLWVLRDHLKMQGTKFGCGIAQCGACTVMLDGVAIRSCVTPVQMVEHKEVLTIEGVPTEHPIKQAWIENDVPQCGYCQSGQMMSAMSFLKNKSVINSADIKIAMAGNICRCGTYPKIEKAIKQAAKELSIDVAMNTAEQAENQQKQKGR